MMAMLTCLYSSCRHGFYHERGLKFQHRCRIIDIIRLSRREDYDAFIFRRRVTISKFPPMLLYAAHAKRKLASGAIRTAFRADGPAVVAARRSWRYATLSMGRID